MNRMKLFAVMGAVLGVSVCQALSMEGNNDPMFGSRSKKNCKIWFDGCNTCKRSSPEDDFASEDCTNVIPDCNDNDIQMEAFCMHGFGSALRADIAIKDIRDGKARNANKRSKKGCKIWFDGCNTCERPDKKSEFVCTEKLCNETETEESYCEERFQKEDKKDKKEKKHCKVWFDGCNECVRETYLDDFSCTKMICNETEESYCKEKFDKGERSVTDSEDETGTDTDDDETNTDEDETDTDTDDDKTNTDDDDKKNKKKKNCKVWFDGCNLCSRPDKKSEFSCTEKICNETEEAFCEEKFEKENKKERKLKKGCKVYFDGCNECTRSWFHGEFSCTKKVCNETEEAYCKEKFEKEDRKEAKKMKWCKVWFDGCNDCVRNTVEDEFACTKKACEELEETYCKEKFEKKERKGRKLSPIMF